MYCNLLWCWSVLNCNNLIFQLYIIIVNRNRTIVQSIPLLLKSLWVITFTFKKGCISMVRFIGLVSGFADIAKEIFGEQIKVIQIKESRDSVEFHLKTTVNGFNFNSVKIFNLMETKRTIVLFTDEQDIICEKDKMFPVDDCPSFKS